MTAEQALHDLTLALIYLTRMSTDKHAKDFWNITDFQAWKGYNWETLDELDREGLISSKPGNKSMWLTAEGVVRAREILANLNIEDWKPKEKT